MCFLYMYLSKVVELEDVSRMIFMYQKLTGTSLHMCSISLTIFEIILLIICANIQYAF